MIVLSLASSLDFAWSFPSGIFCEQHASCPTEVNQTYFCVFMVIFSDFGKGKMCRKYSRSDFYLFVGIHEKESKL